LPEMTRLIFLSEYTFCIEFDNTIDSES